MRETAIPSAANMVVGTTLVVLAMFGAFGCGDDDSSTPDGGPTAGRGGRGGTGGAAGAPIEPLPDKTAGKSCKADKDCGTGTCLTDLPGTFGAGMMPAPGGYCSTACMVNDDCGEGGTCSGAFAGFGGIGATLGRCLKSCTDASQCRDGYRCVNGFGMAVTATMMDAGAAPAPVGGGLLGANTCQPSPATDKLADGIVGSMCADDTACGDGRCLTMAANATMYPGGYCTGSCLADSDCGAMGSCTPGLAGGAGTCYLRCGNDSDCSRDGYRCRANGGLMQCVPGAAPLSDGVVGEACTGDADCGGAAMSCRTMLGSYAAPGGYCTQRCVNATDCGADGVCVGGGGFGGIMTGNGTCYKSCVDASSCRAGYTCGRAGQTGTAATQNICAVTPPPPATDDAGVP